MSNTDQFITTLIAALETAERRSLKQAAQTNVPAIRDWHEAYAEGLRTAQFLAKLDGSQLCAMKEQTKA
jgi:hypothetical protein